MKTASLDRWRELSAALGIAADVKTYRDLIRAYGGWLRHYHSVSHLEACLLEFDAARSCAARPADAEMALWFHDAVYSTRSNDNEQRSADWAARFLSSSGCERDKVDRIIQFVLATKHNGTRLTGDAALVVDVDLSILGQPQSVYDGFEKRVRREYWWVPKRRYRQGRSHILQSFLDRPAVYQTEFFRLRYEVQARQNIARALSGLAQ